VPRGLGQPRDERGGGASAPGAVEVDDVHEPGARGHELADDVGRIAEPQRDVVECAATETDGLAAEHVDRRNHPHHDCMLTC
jgi:hypothetical protein